MGRRSTKALEEALGAGADVEPSLEQRIQDMASPETPPPEEPKRKAVLADKPVASIRTAEVDIEIESMTIRASSLDVAIAGKDLKVTFHGKVVEGVKRLLVEPRNGGWVVKMVLLETERGGLISIVHEE
jgi:hypothetical protein